MYIIEVINNDTSSPSLVIDGPLDKKTHMAVTAKIKNAFGLKHIVTVWYPETIARIRVQDIIDSYQENVNLTIGNNK